MGSLCRVAGLVFVVLLSFCLFVQALVLADPVTPPEENTWIRVTPMHEPRWDLGTAVVEGKIYAMGGLAYKYAEDKFMIVEMELTINEVYDPFSNSWTYRAPMPIASSGFATAVVEGPIVL
jgi:hypothetical protein